MKRTITSAEALIVLKGFNERMARLKADEYSNPRFRTADLNRLSRQVFRLPTLIIRAREVNTRNPERRDAIIDGAFANWRAAEKLASAHRIATTKSCYGDESVI